MSRSRARRMVTSSPPSLISPPVGSSRPAIIRRVVVLPQPEGPSMTKNSPSSTVKLEPLTATKSPNAFCRLLTVICAIALLRELGGDGEQARPRQQRHEGIGIERQRERLHQHDHADGDQRHRAVLPIPPTEPAPDGHLRLVHFRTA